MRKIDTDILSERVPKMAISSVMTMSGDCLRARGAEERGAAGWGWWLGIFQSLRYGKTLQKCNQECRSVIPDLGSASHSLHSLVAHIKHQLTPKPLQQPWNIPS